MSIRLVWLKLFLLFLAVPSAGRGAEWKNVLFLTNGHLKVKVVPEIGRIIHLSGPDGVNVLRQDKTLVGNTEIPAGRWDWNNHGGDWLWPVAQDRWELLGVDRRWPPPVIFEYAPWSGELLPDNQLRLWLEVGAPLHIVVTRVLSFDPEDPTKFVIEQSIRRTAPSDIPVCLWQVAQMGDAKEVLMDVPENTRHPKGFHHIQGQEPEAEALRLTEKILRVQVDQARGAKLGTDGVHITGRSPAGSLRLEVFNEGQAEGLPDGGCSLALAVGRNGDYAEIETMSVERNLAVEEEIRNQVVYQVRSD